MNVEHGKTALVLGSKILLVFSKFTLLEIFSICNQAALI